MKLDRIEELVAGQQVQTQTTGNLTYHVYGSFADAQCLKETWNCLADRDGDVFSSFDWCEVWWQHFGTDRRVEIHTLHDGPRLVAVLPLFRETIRPAGLRLRMVRVVGCDRTGSTIGLSVEPAYAAAFTEMLLDRLKQDGAWDVVQIGSLRSYATAIEQIAEVSARHDSVQNVIIGREDNWLTMFHLPDTYDHFLTSLSSKIRSDTRRRERRLGEQHKVEVSAVSTPEQVPPAMDALIRLHQKRWTDKGQPGQMQDLAVQQFHREVAQRLVKTGQLVLLTMTVDGKVLSVGYGYRFGPRTHPLTVGHCYEEQWQEYGLGRIMHGHLIRHAIEQGSTELEDGRGVFDYKLRLGAKLYGERSLVLVNRGWSKRVRFWLALRAAYVIHVLYSRIWIDMLAPQLPVHPKPRRFYVRNHVLLQLFRRVRFRLFGGPTVLEAKCLEPKPPTTNAPARALRRADWRWITNTEESA